MTACCSAGSATCMRRAKPMPGCGISLSPAISFDVSTMTTRLRSSERMRAHSRNIVVLPTPGRPSKHIEQDVDRAVHGTAHAARETDDLSLPIANRANTMQRLLDAGTVVRAERRDTRADMGDIFVRNRRFG